jgi:hypothetical protein
VLVSSERAGGAAHTMRFAAELGRARFVVVPPDGAPIGPWELNRLCLGEGAIRLPLDPSGALAIIDYCLGRQDGGAARSLPNHRRPGVSPAILQLLLRRHTLCDCYQQRCVQRSLWRY